MSEQARGGVVKKVFLWLLFIGLVGGVWWAWQQPEIRQKVEDYRWYQENADPELYQSVQWWDGEIVKVLDGNWVYVKIQEGFVYALRIRGLEAPTLAIRLSDDTLELGQQAKSLLEELILKKPVRFQSIEMSDIRYGHGYVEFEGRTLVMDMIESGLARLKRSELTHLKRETLFALLDAERKAQADGLGVWAEGLDINWTVGDYSETQVVPAAE